MEQGEARLDDGFIEIPSGKTKTEQPYEIMIGPQAVAIIRGLKSFEVRSWRRSRRLAGCWKRLLMTHSGHRPHCGAIVPGWRDANSIGISR